MKWITDQNQQLLKMKQKEHDGKKLLVDMYVKEQSLKQNYNPSRIISEPDPYGELMSMFLKKQLQNELECRLASRSKNIAIQDALTADKSLSMSSSHKSENKLEKQHDIYEKKTEELPVSAIKWEELPELYIKEEDDEVINRSALEAVSRKEVQHAV